MRRSVMGVVVVWALLAWCGGAGAEERVAGGGTYHLFNPVPREAMREMTTDRPDLTESPFTVDAGRLQAETSFAEYRRDTHTEDGTEVRAWSFAETNLRLGVLENTEFNVVFVPWSDEETKDHGAGTRATADGFSDMQLRMKVNFWGNDGQSTTAFGLLPYLTLPTGSEELGSDHVQGGLIVPLAVAISEDVALGAMGKVDFVYDADDQAYDVEFVHSVTLGVSLIGELSGYVEYAGIISGDAEARYQAVASMGLTYRLTEDVQLDGGVRLGLTRAAEDLAVFSGISVRF